MKEKKKKILACENNNKNTTRNKRKEKETNAKILINRNLQNLVSRDHSPNYLTT